MTDEQHKRQMITRPNRFNIGLDVGWRIWSPIDSKWVEIWWGNTSSARNLPALIGDCRNNHGYTFDLSAETKEAMRACGVEVEG